MHEKTKDIPIIFTSTLKNVVDYITKSFQREEVTARVENKLTLKNAKEQIKQLNIKLENEVKSQNQELEIAAEKLLFIYGLSCL